MILICLMQALCHTSGPSYHMMSRCPSWGGNINYSPASGLWSKALARPHCSFCGCSDTAICLFKHILIALCQHRWEQRHQSISRWRIMRRCMAEGLIMMSRLVYVWQMPVFTAQSIVWLSTICVLKWSFGFGVSGLNFFKYNFTFT